MAPGDVCHGPRCSLAGLEPVALEYCSCHGPGGLAGSRQCVRPMGCWFFPVPQPPYVCAGSCSPVCLRGLLCCVCGVLGRLAPVHRCARSVCCVGCAVSWATWLPFSGVPAGCVVLRVRCSGPLGFFSPMRPLGVLLWVYGVLGQYALVHRCARVVCCVASAVSWDTWLLLTVVPAQWVVLPVRCPGPLGICSSVCPRGLLCCFCGVLGHLAPVRRCARSVCCVGCAVSWATWLPFTGVPAGCVALRVQCPGPLGSCSRVCPFCPWLCLCSVLGYLAPVHRCARSVRCFACAVSRATWLPFTGVPARCVVFCVRCPGPLGSCSSVCPLAALCCGCGGLGHLAPVHRCARSVCCVARAVSWATWLLFTGVPAWFVVFRLRCPGPLGSCSAVCSLGVLCFGLRVRCCVCGASLWGTHSSIRTAPVRSWLGLGTLRARTRPSGRQLFVAGRGWVRCRARTPPFAWRLFVAGRGWVPSGRALVHPDGGWCCLAPILMPWFVACCARSPVLRHPAAVVAWHLSVCLGCERRRASLACLLAPRGAPRLVRSGLSRCSGRFFRRLWWLSPHQGLAPPALLGCCAGHAEAGREPGSLCLPLAPAEAGALGLLRVVPVRGPAMGLSLAGPSGVGLGLRALRWLACVGPVTDASGFLYRPSFNGRLGRCTGAV